LHNADDPGDNHFLLWRSVRRQTCTWNRPHRRPYPGYAIMKAMSRKQRLLIVLACAIPLAAVGVFLLGSLPWGGVELPPPEDEPRAPVIWLEARGMMLTEWVEIVGTTQPLPQQTARVTAPIEGQVVAVLPPAKDRSLAEGQPVKKGEVLVQLDARHAKANRDKVEAQLEELAHLTKQAELAVSVADLKYKSLVELSKKPTNGGSQFLQVPQIEIDLSKLTLKDAEAKLEAAKSRQVAGKKDLEALDEHLSLHTLTASIDGILGRLLVVPGQTLAPGTMVTDILNLDDQIDVLCFVPPPVAKRLKKGQQVNLIGDDQKPIEGFGKTGKIEFIAEQAEMDTGNLAVKVRFPNKEFKLRASTTLRLYVLTQEKACTLTIPMTALLEDQDPPSVIVVDDFKIAKKEGKDIKVGKARKLQVILGIRDRSFRQVEVLGLVNADKENPWSGTLNDSLLFVTERAAGLRTGDLIRLEEEEE
jgi:membrane fusion protein (multidrug efflux system)